MNLTTLQQLIRAEIAVSEARQECFRLGMFGERARIAAAGLRDAEAACGLAWTEAGKEEAAIRSVITRDDNEMDGE